jgi:hypothetical protein
VAGGWLVGSPAFDRLLAWRWRCQIDASDDAAAIGEVRRIAALGEAGLAELAVLLGSDRPCVVEAARQALSDQMHGWSDLEPADRERRRLILARALAEQIGSYSPDARCVASDLAMRILWATSGTDADDSAIIYACDQVLRAGAVSRRQRLLARHAASPEHRDEQRAQQYDENRAPRLANLPGGELFPEELRMPVAQEAPPERPLDSDPRPLASNEPARLPDAASQTSPEAETEAELAQAESVVRHHKGADTGDETEEDASDEAAAELRLMFALRSDDPARRRRAEQDLRSLGYEALQLELARQLTDPDPKVRRELAESLPAMPGVDGRTWLLWLSRDKAADVRLAALTVMATMGDQATLRRIEQMARLDADPRIQRQGERLLKVLEANARPGAGQSPSGSGRLIR